MAKIIEGHTFNPASIALTQDDFGKMADAVGRSDLKDEHKTVLQSLCNEFLLVHASWNGAPRSGKIRTQLEKVKSDTIRLMKTIHDLHDNNKPDKKIRETTIALLLSAAPDSDWASYDFDLMKFSGEVAALGKAAQYAISNLPNDPGGTPADEPLEFLIPRMATIFTNITSKQPAVTYDNYKNEPYSGDFIHFLDAFLAPLDANYQKSNQGLGKKAQRVLELLKSK